MAPERRKQIALGLLPIIVALVLLVQGNASRWVIGAVVVSGLLLVGLLARRGRHTPWQVVAERRSPSGAVVFWKPGCIYCERLLLALRGDERITWVNAWADKDANAEVRRLNNGDELTPTVLIGDEVLRNPSADEVRERLASSAA